jgi:methylenetetrahydrofolate reductase (NADPH)
MNKGVYLDSDMKNQSTTNFCIGVAGYPEKHFESPNLTSDLKNLKHKVDCGAEYIVTQMFFDNSKFYEFVKKCREIGITVPIIPGLKPLTSKSQLNSIPKNFFLTIPEELVETIENSKDDEEVRQIGVDWCVTQSKELMKSGVPVLHYYTMGNWRNTVEIAKKVF